MLVVACKRGLKRAVLQVLVLEIILWVCGSRNFDLCFGGNGGMPGLSRALEPAQGSKVAFGRLLLLPVTKKGLFFGPKRTRKTRDANTGLPSSRFPPRMLFVLK